MSGLRKVDAPFTTVDNAVAEDRSMSFRARGVLVYLLAKPDGWAVRAEAIARDGKEGREAILAVLRELGGRGHYRIVRYREGGPGGPWKTETEVSHRPIPEWAAEWAANEGKPAVRRENAQVSPENGFPGLGGGNEAPDASPQVTPETGFPDAGDPPSGEAASGPPDALVKTLSNETDGRTNTDAGASADVIPLFAEPQPEPTFDDFYARYPLKRDRRAAERAWSAAVRRGAVLSEVMTGVDAYITWLDRAPRRREFIKYPATWLNADSWSNPYDDESSASGTARTSPNANFDGDDPSGGWGQAALGRN